MGQGLDHGDHVGVLHDQGAAQMVDMDSALFPAVRSQSDHARGKAQVAQVGQVGFGQYLGGALLGQPKGLAKGPARGVLEVLLADGVRLPHGQQAVAERDTLAECQGDFAERLRIAQIRQAGLRRHAREFNEIAGIAGQWVGAVRGVALGQGALDSGGRRRQGGAMRIGCRHALQMCIRDRGLRAPSCG